MAITRPSLPHFSFFFFFLWLLRTQFVWLWECVAWFSLQCIVALASDRKRDLQLRMYRNHHSCSTSKMNAIIGYSCAAGAVTVAGLAALCEWICVEQWAFHENERRRRRRKAKKNSNNNINKRKPTNILSSFYFNIMLDWIASISLQNKKEKKATIYRKVDSESLIFDVYGSRLLCFTFFIEIHFYLFFYVYNFSFIILFLFFAFRVLRSLLFDKQFFWVRFSQIARRHLSSN